MAISPTVQAMQQNIVQQQGVSAEQSSFDTKFGEQAFKTLNSKFPELQDLIVTFKVLDSDVATGFAVGTFIIRYEKDVRYIPIIMNEGSIISCEMVYDKVADEFAPLIREEVRSIVSKNKFYDPTLAKKNITREDTTSLYRNMFRPPTSSMVTMASSHNAIQELPNEAKEALSSYFNDNPEVLTKVAKFYDVKQLGAKLAKTAEDSPKEEKESPIQLIKVDEVSKETLKSLSDKDKKELLTDGFVVTGTGKKQEEATKLISLDDVPSNIINTLAASEISLKDDTQASGYGVVFKDTEVELKPVVICGPHIISREGVTLGYGSDCEPVSSSGFNKNRSYGSLVVSSMDNNITADFLNNVGFIRPKNVNTNSIPKSKDNYSSVNIFAAVPAKTGFYKVVDLTKGIYLGDARDLTVNKSTNSNEEDTLYIGKKDNDTRLTIIVSGNLTYGLLRETSDKSNVVLPKNSFIYIKTDTKVGYIRSFKSLFNIVNTVYPKVKVTKDLTKIQVKDSITKQASTFYTPGDATLHLVNTYGISADQAKTTLSRGGALLYKTASPFINPAQQEYGVQQEQPVASSMYQQQPQPQAQPQAQPQQQPMMQPQPQQPQQQPMQVNGELLNSAAELQDDKIMDTGMLASLVNNKDIKVLLVDHLPSFSEATNNLGRTILVSSINKKDLIEYFGTEQYNTLLNKLRHIFTQLGETVYNLKKYVNMV